MKEVHEKVNEALTNQFLTLISKGVAPWRKGWATVESGLGPFNVNSGRQYNGINAMILSAVAGGRIPAFAPSSKNTPNVKGAESTIILRPFVCKYEDKVTGEEKSFIKSFGFVRVFHYTDLKGIDHKAIEEKYTEKKNEFQGTFNSIEACEELIKNMQNCPNINHGGNRAYYMPSKDHVQMPKKEQFEESSNYYLTLFHELSHSTMHFTRLDRKQSREGLENQTHEYSFEELVAELSACFLGSHCGIMDSATLENSAAYLKGWIKPLQSNPDWIIKASSEANKSFSYILGTNKKEG